MRALRSHCLAVRATAPATLSRVRCSDGRRRGASVLPCTAAAHSVRWCSATAKQPPASRPGEDEKVVMGNPEHGTMPPVRVAWTALVGVDEMHGKRVGAGDLLRLLDTCAGRCAFSVRDEMSQRHHRKYRGVTASATNIIFSSAIMHGDAVRLDARVIHCGESSLGLYIRAFRQSLSPREEVASGEAFFTQVIVDEQMKSAKVMPSMTLTDPFDIALHRRYLSIQELQRQSERHWRQMAAKTLTPAEVDCPVNREKQSFVSMASTRWKANRIFFTSFINNNKTAFGGEVMAWMERHARHCARIFTGNRNVHTLGMHSVFFNQPIYGTDWLSVEATVTYVRHTTMEVEVRITADRDGKTNVLSNRAAFVLVNLNEADEGQTISRGLDLNGASQEELHAYMKSRWRYSRSKEWRDQFQTVIDDSKKQQQTQG